MKILFNLGSLGKGGAERVVSILSNHFCTQGHNIDIVTSVNMKNYYKLNNKIKIYSLDERNKKDNFFTRNIYRLIRLKKIVKDINPDIIISFLPEPSYRMLFVNYFNKRKIIVSVRNDPKIEYNNFVKKCIMKVLYKRANGFVFQTKEAQEFFSKKIQKKSVIIPNPIKNEFIERKLYEGKRENTIVSVGRLEQQKNFDLLIDAFYDINKDISDYKLIIYGEGSLRTKLEKKVNELNMKDRIFLPGNVDNVAEKIERSKLFVMTSDYEGMPNALMEAMALGLVCISTDCPCGGPKFLIEDGKNGFLFDVNNKEQLKSIVKNLILNNIGNNLDTISMNSKKSMMSLKEEKINLLWYDYICKVIKP